jgi:hypothetical protein
MDEEILPESVPVRISKWKTWNFHDHYTIRPAFELQKSLPFFFVTVFFWGLVVNDIELLQYGITRQYLHITALIASGILGVVYLYWSLYRQTILFRIDNLRIISSRGLLLQNVVSCPFSAFWNWDLIQTPLDWLFNVYRIQIYGDYVPYHSLLLLPALSREEALDFYNLLRIDTDRGILIADGARKIERAS